MRGAALLPALVAPLLLAVGCGRKADPVPPPSPVPAAVEDLAAAQRGDGIELAFTHPRTTVGGLALPALRRVEVLELRMPVRPEAEPEPPDRHAFGAAAETVVALEGDELARAAVGERLRVVVPLPLPHAEAPRALVYAVRAQGPRGPASEVSNFAVVLPIAPPPAPEDVGVEPRPDGVEVRWRHPGESAAAVRVFRRRPEEPAPGRLLATVPASDERFVDGTARFGETYVYAFAGTDADGKAESELAAAEALTYEDRFPPSPPAGLAALAAAGRVRLVWDPSPEEDVAGYLVYRSRPGEEPAPLFDDPLPRTDYEDRDVAAGVTYVYLVTAVDLAGSESGPGEPAEVRLP